MEFICFQNSGQFLGGTRYANDKELKETDFTLKDKQQKLAIKIYTISPHKWKENHYLEKLK